MQLQLLTYLDAVAKIEKLEPVAVLYFGLADENLDKRKSPEEIEEEIKKNFRMNGLVVADVKLIKMMDKNLEAGDSKLIPASITQKRRTRQKAKYDYKRPVQNFTKVYYENYKRYFKRNFKWKNRYKTIL